LQFVVVGWGEAGGAVEPEVGVVADVLQGEDGVAVGVVVGVVDGEG
jgi:hypothetical protein